MNSSPIPFAAGSPQAARAAGAAEERERLGSLLHDGVLQSLNVAALELANLKLELMAAADLGVTYPALPFAAMLQASDALERHLRLACGDLRGWLRRETNAPPASFAAGRQPDGNLAGALRWLVLQRLRFALEEQPAAPSPLDDTGRDWHGCIPGGDGRPTVRLRMRGAAATLPPAVEAEVLAIVQEALLNAHRHGRARTILLAADFHAGDPSPRETPGGNGATVHTGKISGGMSATVVFTGPSWRTLPGAAAVLKLVVLDDGLPPGALPLDHGKTRGGFGQRAMSARAARLGGALSIAQAPPAGTCVRLELPLPSTACGAGSRIRA